MDDFRLLVAFVVNSKGDGDEKALRVEPHGPFVAEGSRYLQQSHGDGGQKDWRSESPPFTEDE